MIVDGQASAQLFLCSLHIHIHIHRAYTFMPAIVRYAWLLIQISECTRENDLPR